MNNSISAISMHDKIALMAFDCVRGQGP